MSELTPTTPESAIDEPLLDTFLREGLPEVKLRLGDEIDRDNQRAIPDRFARLLPGSVLVITLRPDVAAAVADIAAELERELTDSVMRHGSLYDREYRVKLRVANAAGAALFRVSVRRGNEPEPEPFVPPRPAPPAPAPAATTSPRGEAEGGATIAAPAPRPAPASSPAPEPAMDPDATRLEGVFTPEPPDWDGARWVLAVEDEEGAERERCAVAAPITTVGRQTDNAELRSDVAITDAPHVSRRQLVLEWAPRGGDPGFTVYNVGLNALHVGEKEVPGANRGKGELALDELAAHTDWVAPGAPLRVGEHGPVLRLVDTRPPPEPEAEPVVEEVPSDPDATVLG